MPGGVPPLTVEAAEAYHVQAPEWVLRDEATRIERTYRFRSFGDAFAFVRPSGNSPRRHSIILILASGGAMPGLAVRVVRGRSLCSVFPPPLKAGRVRSPGFSACRPVGGPLG